MNQVLQKFSELLEEDTVLQEKIKTAAENYTGEKTLEATFTNIVIPVAEEAGFHFTWEDAREYSRLQSDSTGKIDLNEMDQVAGGRGKASITDCIKVGIGFGPVKNDDDDRTFCLGPGFGGE